MTSTTTRPRRRPGQRRERPASIWRHRDLRLVIPARAASRAGDALVMFALTLRIHAAGGGASQIALMMATFAIPTIAAVGISGHVADRHDSRTILVTASAVQAAAVAAMAVTGTGPAMYALIVALQLGQAFANPTWAALLPRVVGDDDLTRATATQQAVLAMTGVAGAALAGVLVGRFDVPGALWAASVAFTILGVVACLVRTRRRPAPTQPATATKPGTVRRTLAPLWSTQGFTVMRADHLTWVLFTSMVPFVLVLESANVAEVFLVRDALGASSTMFGVVQACSAAGAIVGAWWAARLRDERTRLRMAVGGVAGVGAALLVAGQAPVIPVLAVGFFGIGMFVMASNACLWPVLILRTAEGDRGKVNAAANGAARVASMAALAVGALAGTALGPRWSFTAAAALAVAVSAGAWWSIQHRTTQPAAAAEPVEPSPAPEAA